MQRPDDAHSVEVRPAPSRAGSIWRRLAWFVAIWAMSVTALGIVAYGIRLFLM